MNDTRAISSQPVSLQGHALMAHAAGGTPSAAVDPATSLATSASMVAPMDWVEAAVAPKEVLFITGEGDSHAIDGNDVRQNAFADCYLLSSLVGLAENNPGFIEGMIRTNRDAHGNVESYSVRLYQKDEEGRLVETYVTVDAKDFPEGAAKVGDEKNGQKEIWPRVIEKAYAQLVGGYDSINYGNAGIAMETLTGIPSDGYSANSYSFDQLQKDFQAGRTICVLTPDIKDKDGNPINPGKDELLTGEGLYADHYYTVVGIKIEDGKHYVKLNNPWGEQHPGADDDGWVCYDDLVARGMFEAVSVGPSRVEMFAKHYPEFINTRFFA